MRVLEIKDKHNKNREIKKLGQISYKQGGVCHSKESKKRFKYTIFTCNGSRCE